MGTFIVGAIVAAAVVAAIYSMARDRKKGKSVQCGADCSQCRGHCH